MKVPFQAEDKRRRKFQREPVLLLLAFHHSLLTPWCCPALLPSVPRSFSTVSTKWYPFYRLNPHSRPWFLFTDKWQRAWNSFISAFCSGVRSNEVQPFNLEYQGRKMCCLCWRSVLSEEWYPKHKWWSHNRREREAYFVQCNQGIQAN